MTALSPKPSILKRLLPLLLLVGGVAIAVGLTKMRKRAKKQAPGVAALSVDVVTVHTVSVPFLIQTTGVVAPAQQIVLQPQVGGAVIWQTPQLVPGGRVDKGAQLVRIDPREYDIAVRQAKAVVDQAKVDLRIEGSRAGIAKKEWALLGDGRSDEEAAFALRKPQLAASLARLEGQRVNLERAELNRSRTVLRAPFNALILKENVDKGQVIGGNSKVATLIGTDQFWLTVSVSVDKLAHLRMHNGDEKGSKALVRQRLEDGSVLQREGEVLRLAGALDPATRTAKVVVGIDHPLDDPSGGLPLLPNAFVDVELRGTMLNDVLQVPRRALVAGNTVWLASADNKLKKRNVNIVFGDANEVAIDDGLQDGDHVIVTRLALPLEGLPVAIANDLAPTNKVVDLPKDTQPPTTTVVQNDQ